MTHHILLIQYCASVVTKVCEHWLLKSVFSVFIYLLFFLLDPTLTTEMFALLVLVIFDTITAVIAAYKTEIPIQSRKVFKSAVKIVIYFLLVSAGHLTEYVIPIPYIDDVVIGFLVLTEMVSILENFGRAGYSVPKQLLAQLQKLKETK